MIETAIVPASYTEGRISMGDLEQLGLARKNYHTNQVGDVDDIQWEYLGDSPILVDQGNGKYTVAVKGDMV